MSIPLSGWSYLDTGDPLTFATHGAIAEVYDQTPTLIATDHLDANGLWAFDSSEVGHQPSLADGKVYDVKITYGSAVRWIKGRSKHMVGSIVYFPVQYLDYVEQSSDPSFPLAGTARRWVDSGGVEWTLRSAGSKYQQIYLPTTYKEFTNSAAPTAPAAGKTREWVDTNGKLWLAQSAGTAYSPFDPRINQLTNGGMEWWQRGNGPFTTVGYTADRWYLAPSGGTISVGPDTAHADGGGTCYAVTTTGGSGGYILQQLEFPSRYAGKYVTYSVRCRTTDAGMCLGLNPGDGLGTTSTVPTDGAYHTISITRLVPAATTYVNVYLFPGGAGTFYFDSAMLAVSPIPVEYTPLHPQEDLARCQRYYETLWFGSQPIMQWYDVAGDTHRQFLPFKVAKGGIPTVTRVGVWYYANTNNALTTVEAPGREGFVLRADALGTGAVLLYTDALNSGFTAEWNP